MPSINSQSPLPYLRFPGSSAGKESSCNAGDLSSTPGLGRSPEEGKGYPLQYSGLENSVNCIVHGVAKSWTWLSDFHFHLLSPLFTQYFWSTPDPILDSESAEVSPRKDNEHLFSWILLIAFLSSFLAHVGKYQASRDGSSGPVVTLVHFDVCLKCWY